MVVAAAGGGPLWNAKEREGNDEGNADDDNTVDDDEHGTPYGTTSTREEEEGMVCDSTGTWNQNDAPPSSSLDVTPHRPPS